jgi:menaquinol-cytochrome c reductase iron-sulfur subunit
VGEFLGVFVADQPIVNESMQKETTRVTRRSFFGGLLAIGTAGMGALLAVPVLRFVFYPLYTKAGGIVWSDVGSVDELPTNEQPLHRTVTFTQRDGWREVVSAQSVYVTRDSSGQFQVLSAICPHMGCSVSWQADHDRFVCPCHGGEFKADGERISGPPPRAMDQLPTRVRDGKLQVDFKYFRSNVPNQESLS